MECIESYANKMNSLEIDKSSTNWYTVINENAKIISWKQILGLEEKETIYIEKYVYYWIEANIELLKFYV